MPKIRSVLAVLALLSALVACGPAEEDGPVSSWLSGDSSSQEAEDAPAGEEAPEPSEEPAPPEPTCSAEETVPEAEALPVEDWDNAAAVGDC
ncbi:hypothetical protein [Streptosporangium sp. NPDC048865]|uniref:hypothetical protein n=1 Tax=Streptosporangium sp. NPDC048865 TaxID=3155766 RepID=UPI00342D9B39